MSTVAQFACEGRAVGSYLGEDRGRRDTGIYRSEEWRLLGCYTMWLL
jgi:hypothetical protein